MLAGYNHNVTTITVTGGTTTSGTATYPVMIAPYGGITVKAAYVNAAPAIAGNGSNYVTLNLLDGGAAGTATTSIGTAGGTAGVTLAPAAMTISTNALDAGDYLIAKLGRIGTIAQGEFTISVEWVHGQG